MWKVHQQVQGSLVDNTRMSLGYAERLSFREDLGGRLGDPEILEQAQEVLQKVEQLTDLVSSCANHHYCVPPPQHI
jgi:hypothetical protein